MTVEYECSECDYWDHVHSGDLSKLKEKCSNCLKPIRERLQGHGIYGVVKKMEEANGHNQVRSG